MKENSEDAVRSTGSNYLLLSPLFSPSFYFRFALPLLTHPSLSLFSLSPAFSPIPSLLLSFSLPSLSPFLSLIKELLLLKVPLEEVLLSDHLIEGAQKLAINLEHAFSRTPQGLEKLVFPSC